MRLDLAVSGADAGLRITPTVRVDDSGETMGTVAVENLGPGSVRINHPRGGVDVLGVDRAGSVVRDGDVRLRALDGVEIAEGAVAELPAHVHSTVCGPGDEPASFLAVVAFTRDRTAQGGLALG
jgi:hypothetical protein